MHDLVTAFLVWMFAGSLVWMVLYASGLAAEVRLRRLMAGKATTIPAFLVANVMVAVVWPVFVVRYLVTRRVWR